MARMAHISGTFVVKFEGILKEEAADEIQAWCKKYECGQRIAYSIFKFKNEGEVAFFLLKWADIV